MFARIPGVTPCRRHRAGRLWPIQERAVKHRILVLGYQFLVTGGPFDGGKIGEPHNQDTISCSPNPYGNGEKFPQD
jgi:hypothetical protein